MRAAVPEPVAGPAAGAGDGLQALLRHPRIWRGGRGAQPDRAHQPSGWPDLDRNLPGGGWPLGALTEVYTERLGIGEVSLFMPVLAPISQAGRRVVWVAPPCTPYAPALAGAALDLRQVLMVRPRTAAEGLWAAEQLLASAATGALLLWVGQAEDRRLRRLQLAAENSAALSVLFRPLAAASQASPAALRVQLLGAARGLQVQVLKCRGRLPGRALQVR